MSQFTRSRAATKIFSRRKLLNNGSLMPRTRFAPVLVPWKWVRRLLDLHILNEVADEQTRNIEFADRGWPQRLEPFRKVDVGPFSDLKNMMAMQRYVAADSVRQQARNAALLRRAYRRRDRTR